MTNPFAHQAWIIAPVLLPALVAASLILLRIKSVELRRGVSFAAAAATLLVTIGLYAWAQGAPQAYHLGDWPAPFGITLVLDRLSATMILLTAVLSFVVLLHASDGWDTRGVHFHALLQFQIMGVNGAFLTGDLFNLFVFFEVMLIASYGLLLHGGGPRRLSAGFHYVAINLVGSTLFLFAVGLVYGVTGALNMADVARKAASVAPGDAALLKTGAMLLFLVFAIKSSLAPLHWWLPNAYAAASPPAAAFFAIMTKVGVYAIIRVYALVFGGDDGGALAGAASMWMAPAAIATMIIGALGALASKSLRDLVVFAVVWSMGSLFAALAGLDAKGLAAGLYYALHSTLAAAALFLLVDAVARGRGALADRITSHPWPPREALAATFFVAAIAMCGLPPLSGFIGKLLILDAVRAGGGFGGGFALTWAVVLVTSLMMIVGFARAGSTLFWRSPVEATPAPALPSAGAHAAVALALAAIVALTVFAGPVVRHMDAAAAQTLARTPYIDAVFAPVREARR